MIRRSLFLLAALTLLAVPALAGRSKKPALTPGVIRAEPNDKAAKVVDVKKGENLMVLGKKGDWSNVQTDAGKKGWVLSSVVSSGGLEGLDPNATTVAAAEGETAIAMRGRPFVPATVVVGMGGLKNDASKKLGELLKAERKLKILEVRDEAATKTGSAAGGLDGATQLAGTQKADLVVAIQAGTGDALIYEIVDLKNKAVLGTGTTTSAKPVEEVATAVAKVTAELTKNPADQSAATTPAPAAAATAAPAAIASPTPDDAKKGTGNPTLKKRK